MKVIRLPQAKVQLGIPLPWNVRDQQGNLLLSKGHILANEAQVEQLLERGAFVDVEEVVAAAHEEAPVQAAKVVVPLSLFGMWDQTSEALRLLFLHPDKQADFPAQVDAFAMRILELVDCNVDISIYRAVRQENYQASYYGYAHSVHTAVLCILLARHLRWPAQRMMSLVKAALTMNLSILDLQGQMAAQDIPMKDRQRAEIHGHPAKAVELLTALGVADDDWLAAIAQHHEHPDGTGYPSACTDMGEMAIALRVADIFMAKISPRVLRAALSPQEAIRQLYREDKGGAISTAVVKEFGIYPPGDFVKLASGELGIVVERTANAKAPMVASITDTAGRPVPKTLRRDTGQAPFAITGTASDKTLLKRLPPERLYGYSKAPAPH